MPSPLKGMRLPIAKPKFACHITIPQLGIKCRLKPLSEMLEVFSDDSISQGQIYVTDTRNVIDCKPLLNTIYHVNIAVPDPHKSIRFVEEYQDVITSQHKEAISKRSSDQLDTLPENTSLIEEDDEQQESNQKATVCMIS